MSDVSEWTLNRNAGTDVLHPDPREECNLDDSAGRTQVDAETADALMQLGQARLCEHCGTDAAAP